MRTITGFCLLLCLMSCKGGKQVPDVSNISVQLTTQRFEQDFFRVDTLQLDASLNLLTAKIPGFTRDFLFNILGTTPNAAANDVPQFIRTYVTVYKDAQARFPQLNQETAVIKKGLQFVRYYFPQYAVPTKLITFIGPLNSYGNIITTDALGVGLQLYMGKDYPLYLSEQGQQLYPRFVSRRFEPAYMPVNCMKNVLDDMFPVNYAGRPLIEQMVEAGKRLYLLDQLLPETADTLKTGYTQAQLAGCYAHEKQIWALFVQNNLLYVADPEQIRDYMSDAPSTPALGEASPGFIGQFVGWQIVKKWMLKQSKADLSLLMRTPAKQVFEEAKYKP